MKVILFVFLSLLTSAGTKVFISPDVVLPGDYLEEEKEEDDDDEIHTTVEPSPAEFVFDKGEEKENSQEEDALESIFGPHYLSTPTQRHSEEPALDGSDNTDLLPRNRAAEISLEDFKVNGIFILSCISLACSLIFMICYCTAFIKDRMAERNFSGHSYEHQRQNSASYLDPLREGPDSSASRAAESSQGVKKMASDLRTAKKSTKSDTLPTINSVADMPPITHVSSQSSPLEN